MESVKQWEMDEETRRDGLGEGSNRTESNNQLRNTRGKKGELIFQRDVPNNNEQSGGISKIPLISYQPSVFF